MELDLNIIHSKREIARHYFPGHNEKYGWSLIVMICKVCHERYVLPHELKTIVKALNLQVLPIFTFM